MKPFSLTIFALVLFASQGLACSVKGTGCGTGNQLGDKACSCDGPNLVSRAAIICCYVLMCVSFNAVQLLVGEAFGSFSKIAQKDVLTKHAAKHTCCDS